MLLYMYIVYTLYSWYIIKLSYLIDDFALSGTRWTGYIYNNMSTFDLIHCAKYYILSR